MLEFKKQADARDVQLHRAQQDSENLLRDLTDLRQEASQLRDRSDTAEKRRQLAEEGKHALEKDNYEHRKNVLTLKEEKESILLQLQTRKAELDELKGNTQEMLRVQEDLYNKIAGGRQMAEAIEVDYKKQKERAEAAEHDLEKVKSDLEARKELMNMTSDHVEELTSRLEEVETRGRLEDKALHAMLESKYAHERIKKEELEIALEEVSTSKNELEFELRNANKEIENIHQTHKDNVSQERNLMEELNELNTKCVKYEHKINKLQAEINAKEDCVLDLEDRITKNEIEAAKREKELQGKLEKIIKIYFFSKFSKKLKSYPKKIKSLKCCRFFISLLQNFYFKIILLDWCMRKAFYRILKRCASWTRSFLKRPTTPLWSTRRVNLSSCRNATWYLYTNV